MAKEHKFNGEVFAISMLEGDCGLEVKYGEHSELVRFDENSLYFTGGGVSNRTVTGAVENACNKLLVLAKGVDGCGPIKEFYEGLVD